MKVAVEVNVGLKEKLLIMNELVQRNLNFKDDENIVLIPCPAQSMRGTQVRIDGSWVGITGSCCFLLLVLPFLRFDFFERSC